MHSPGCVELRNILHTLQHARGHLRQRFAARRRGVKPVLLARRPFRSVALLNVGCQHAFPLALVHLAQPSVHLHRQPKFSGDDLRSNTGALQVAAVDGGKTLVAQLCGRGLSLRQPDGVERLIRLPLIAPLYIPVSLTVAHDPEFGHGATAPVRRACSARYSGSANMGGRSSSVTSSTSSA